MSITVNYTMNFSCTPFYGWGQGSLHHTCLLRLRSPAALCLAQVSEACDAVFVAGKESRGAQGVRVDFWWRRLRASLRMTVWAPLLPLRIELTDTTLEQVRGWRVPSTADG